MKRINIVFKKKHVPSEMMLKACCILGTQAKSSLINELTSRYVSKAKLLCSNARVTQPSVIENAQILSYTKNHSIIGVRHAKSLPIRGQRTHTNSKTQKRISHKRVATKQS